MEKIFDQNNKVAKFFNAIDTTIGLLLETELDKISNPSLNGRGEYEEAIVSQFNIYNRFEYAFKNIKFLTSYYADLECELTDKVKHIFEIDNSFFNTTFQKFYYTDFENDSIFIEPFSKGYFFSSASNYLEFVFLKVMMLNSNICSCFNCKGLFVAKTKKRTFYCDRVQSEDGKTCKQIGPQIRTELQLGISGFKDYDKAVERNYKRMQRTRDCYHTENATKLLSYEEYDTWLQKAKFAKEQWIKEEINDDEFLKILHELD